MTLLRCNELPDYAPDLFHLIPAARPYEAPWSITAHLADILRASLAGLETDYRVEGEIAIHRHAVIEPLAVIKAPCIVGPGCFVPAFAYLRGGVFLGQGTILGPSVEIKSSILLEEARIAHLSFVGDSIVGSDVNIEAGAVIANHRNERADKEIHVKIGSIRGPTGVEKFGALIGDRSRIGANAVLAPGTILEPGSIVPRLALLDQDAQAGMPRPAS